MCIPHICAFSTYVYQRASARGCCRRKGGWRWRWKETENIPIGPLWYSGATMLAIGRRSTKPLNDPSWRSGATATLFQSRKSSCAPDPSRTDFRCEITPFFDINRPMYRRSRAYSNTIASLVDGVSYPQSPVRSQASLLWDFDKHIWTVTVYAN